MATPAPQRLVGRDRELDTLGQALDDTARGVGRLVVVAGEPGIGKTTLVQHVRRDAARRHMAGMVGRAVLGPSAVPLRPIAEVLMAATRDRPLPLTGPLSPFTAPLQHLLVGQADAVTDMSELVLGEGVLRALRAIAEPAGAVLVLEDLQWADPDTVAVVHHLADHVGASRLLVLATVRTGGGDSAAALVRSLAGREASSVVQLERLDRIEVGHLAELYLGRPPEPALLDVLEERAEGVPLLLDALLAGGASTSASGVPPSFAAAVDQRLSELAPPVRRVLEVAAVLGRSFDVDAVATALGRRPRSVADDLRAARSSGLLEHAAAASGRFRHALVRDALLARLLPDEIAQLASAAAGAVEARSPLDPRDQELAARLRIAAGQPRLAAAHLLVAGRSARRQGALSTAVATLQRARELASADRSLLAEVEEDLIHALALAARADEAAAIGRDLLVRLASDAEPPARQARVHVRLAEAAEAATRWEVARSHVDEARASLSDGGASSSREGQLWAQLDVIEARILIGNGDLDGAARLAERARGAADRLGAPGIAGEALEVMGRRERLRDLDRARTAFEQQLQIAETYGMRLLAIRALHELGTIDMFTRADGGRLESARRMAEDVGAVALTAVIDLQLAGLYGVCFAPERALEAASRCRDLAAPLGLHRILLMALLQGAFAHVTAGRGDEAERWSGEAVRRAGDDPELHALLEGHVRATRSLLEERRGDALKELDAAMSHVDRMDGVPPGILTGLWALLHTIQDVDGAEAHARVAGTDLAGHPLIGDMLRLAEAVLLGREGRGEEAERLVATVSASLEAHGVHHIRGLVLRLVAEAALEDSWGAPIAWLRQTLRTFDATPHQALADACRALLRRGGARTPRPAGGVPAQLAALGVTRREFEVLELVATRLSNNEIATRLFISPRTVEKHVERLLQKTGADDRRGLADQLRTPDHSGT